MRAVFFGPRTHLTCPSAGPLRVRKTLRLILWRQELYTHTHTHTPPAHKHTRTHTHTHTETRAYSMTKIDLMWLALSLVFPL